MRTRQSRGNSISLKEGHDEFVERARLCRQLWCRCDRDGI